MKFNAMIVKEEDGKYIRSIEEKDINELPDNDVIINVKYSSLNYKDALSAIGNKGVTKQYPHTPGIDAAGVVYKSKSDKFKEGEEVILTGYDLGMNTPGGFGEYISVPASWVIKKPDNLTLKESMIFGTAGFTAALSIIQLEKYGLTPESGEILVTGATGGVGSMAVAMLSESGYNVVAATGKKEKEEMLKSLGASQIIDRKEIDDESGKPMLKPRWGGVVDTVGGNILVTAIKSLKYGCSATTCGLTKSHELNLTVFPFILRGVNLLGIDSVEQPIEVKENVWNNISQRWNKDYVQQIYQEVSLEQLSEKIDLILKGQIAGRVVVKI
ncbi:YhdH/YhfP family quinone oxidoreductase [Deferribacterales bacterium Es71-Z0220]|uniref:YhdH/YhfP family quinone oxidoreductase n=1 Tax=Deferrivibrio essentukiensis TaxID=2880922 RepID=UPI001F5FF7C9|nr:YhdH/YhfP family quinone oxidoreductase [Deferrivibrio essentukiensis]MCB4204738.1 YhdH/YhfP family quinone oxidoreductase [Deferrivibrio essentukiensis]